MNEFSYYTTLDMKTSSVVDFSPDLHDTPGWRVRHQEGWEIWMSGYTDNTPSEIVAILEKVETGEGGPNHSLMGITGQFALAARRGNFALAMVDRVRSIPISYAQGPNGWIIDPIGGRLAASLGLSVFDPVGELSFAMAGYTIGKDTIFSGLDALVAGEVVIWRGATPERRRYYRYVPRPFYAESMESAYEQLADLTLSILQRLIDRANGREIVVPLSAGLDSRLIVSGLKQLGYGRVRTFSYGLPGNHEANAAKAIADHLGYPWCFVKMTPAIMSAFYATDLHTRYLAFADSAVSCPFEQDIMPLNQLQKEGWIGSDAIIANGNSGDYISGGHIPQALAEAPREADTSARSCNVISAMLAKHFQLWSSFSNKTNLEVVRQRLSNEIGLLRDAGVDIYSIEASSLFELLEFENRQTKYVINGQRAYEFLGLQWSLPLWDNDYLDFWERVPLKWKTGQGLYRQMLYGENWGGVWSDRFEFRYTVRPRWIVPLRSVAKCIHAPLGRDRWHRSERRLFGWWMDTMAASSVVPYRKALCDTLGARNSVSWHTRAYLEAKGSALFNIQ